MMPKKDKKKDALNRLASGATGGDSSYDAGGGLSGMAQSMGTIGSVSTSSAGNVETGIGSGVQMVE
jgi:hypothetical protein